MTFLYLDAPDNSFAKVAATIASEIRENGVQVRAVKAWHEPYFPGYSRNPFTDIVRDTYEDTRSEYQFTIDIENLSVIEFA